MTEFRSPEEFLATLERHLRPGHANAALLAEIADHLCESVDRRVAQGADRIAAELAAVHDLGDPRSLARELRRQQRGLPSAWTGLAGLVGVMGGVLGLIALAGNLYSTLAPVYHPRVVQLWAWSSFVAELFPLLFLTGLCLRAADPRRVRSTVMTVTGPAVVTTALAIAFRVWFASDFGSVRTWLGWVDSLAALVLCGGLLRTLRPWSARQGYGPRASRVLLTAGYLGEAWFAVQWMFAPDFTWSLGWGIASWLTLALRWSGMVGFGALLVSERLRRLSTA